MTFWQLGLDCGLHAIERLMQINHQSKAETAPVPIDVGEHPVTELAANVLRRQFNVSAPNRNWATDFTRLV